MKVTAAERTRLSRERRKEQGCRWVQVMVDPAAAQALDALLAKGGRTQAEIVSEALVTLSSAEISPAGWPEDD